MSQVAPRIAPSISKPIPPLQNGDHLTRDEFERRYEATPAVKKAELIEGVVYVSPPVSFDGHSRPHSHFTTLLGAYSASTPGVASSDNGTVRLDLDNMPQPDSFLIILPSHGGQAKIDADDYIAGAPELVAEITASAASYDLHEKLRVYRRNGVREYIVWRTRDGEFDYFILRQAEYQRLAPASDGSFHSEVFPGLWLDAPALLKGDLAGALATVQQGLAWPEHQSFITALKQRAESKQS
jgi:Uma2 family endonuclease